MRRVKKAIPHYPNPMQYLRDEFGQNIISGAEIGVKEEATSLKLIKELNISKLYLIDIWGKYTLHVKIRSPKQHKLHSVNFAKSYDKVFNLCKENNNLQMIKMDSVQASQWFADRSLDFVFIDGNHDYEYVSKDIHTWFDKVRDGGIICGHDYCSQREGVVNAVKEFAEQHELALIIDEDWNWMVRKSI